MAHSHYSFEIRQVRSHLILIRHPRSQTHSPYTRYLKRKRTLPSLPGFPTHSIPTKDIGEFLKEISKLGSVSEKISKLDDIIKELKEANIYRNAALANLDEEEMLINEENMIIDEQKKILDEKKRILDEKKRNLDEKQKILDEKKRILDKNLTEIQLRKKK